MGNSTQWDNWRRKALLLPYMELKPLYDSANFSLAPVQGGTLGNAVNQTAFNTVINSFLCPSDGNAGKGSLNSYAACQGTTIDNIRNGSSGMFTYQTNYGLADVTDGSSQTIAYSEVLTDNPRKSVGARGVATQGGGGGPASGSGNTTSYDISTNLANMQADLAACNAAYQSGTIGSGYGYSWGGGLMGMSMFNSVVPPNGQGRKYLWSACRMDCCPQAAHSHYVNASSNHSGGVNVLMGDGSVKFIKDSTAIIVWQALGTKANGETVSADQY